MRHRFRARPLCPKNKAFQACQAVADLRSRVPPSLLAPYLLATVLRPGDSWPPRFPAAAWTRHGILLPPSPIEKILRKPRPARDAISGCQAEVSMPPEIPFPPAASDAIPGSFQPGPDGPERNREMWRARYQWIVLKATRWRAPDNKAGLDHWDAWRG